MALPTGQSGIIVKCNSEATEDLYSAEDFSIERSAGKQGVVALPQSPTSTQGQDVNQNVVAASVIPPNTTSADRRHHTPEPLSAKEKSNNRANFHTAKHAPVCKAGTKFHWSDNEHIDDTPVKVGVVEKKKLRLMLRDTEGKYHGFPYHHRQDMDWNNKKAISKCNKWRKQIFSRRLNGTYSDKENQKCRPHWTEREKVSVTNLALEQIKITQRRLSKKDWSEITDLHNARFEGVEIKVGEKMPRAINMNNKSTKATVVKVSHFLPARSASAVYSQAFRWPDTKEAIEEETAKYAIFCTDQDIDDAHELLEHDESEEESVVGSMVGEHNGDILSLTNVQGTNMNTDKDMARSVEVNNMATNMASPNTMASHFTITPPECTSAGSGDEIYPFYQVGFSKPASKPKRNPKANEQFWGF